MPLYIAADGGGTKTLFRLINENREILAELTAPGTNPVHIGQDRAVGIVRKSVGQLLELAGREQEDVHAAALFIPVLWRSRGVLDAEFPFRAEVLSDTLAAKWAALGSEDGIVILSGTGSFAIGSRGDRMLHVGGWGSYIDDAGSGFSIGQAALRHAAMQYDAEADDDELSCAIKSRFDMQSIDELKARQADRTFLSPAVIASLCPLVEKSAENGCGAAREILENAAEELAWQAGLCKERLGFKPGEKFKIRVTGGAVLNNRIFGQLCLNRLKATFPEADVSLSLAEPIEGAVDYLLR